MKTSRPHTRPLWVKVLFVVVFALALLFVVLKLTGLGGEHGPGRHLPADDGVTEDHTPPADHGP